MKETEDYLNRIPLWASKKNSLQAIGDFLGELGHPDQSMKILHVAGTNGKGSVCAYLTSMLNGAGRQTATFISPHLVSVKERFLWNGKPVGDKEFEQAFQEIKKLSETMKMRGYEHPAYFEFLFYMFMVMAEKKKPDFVILETGLGGLLDTTNVINHPLLTIITSVSMDHMQYLGSTISEIAAQKAGILKQGAPVVYDAECPESSKVIQKKAEELHCPRYPVFPETYQLTERKRGMMRLNVQWKDEPVAINISSEADYQMMNASLAVYAVKVMGLIGEINLSSDEIARGIEKSYWPGRMEEVLPEVWLDGAHNAGGMEALTRIIMRLQQETKKTVSLMFGVAADKDYHEMIRKLCSHVKISHVTIVHMDTDRSAETEELARKFKEKLTCPIETFDRVSQAWENFLNKKGEGLAFCAGSLYLVGEIKALIHCLEEKND